MTANGPVIVTGASTGIGAAAAKQLTEAGRDVITIDLASAPEHSWRHYQCDLNDPSSIDEVAGQLEGRYASLVNVAGVPGTMAAELVIGVNTLGLRHFTEAMWDRIADNGTVVNVSSMAGNNWKKRFDLHHDLLATPDFAAGIDWWESNAKTCGVDSYTFSKEAVVVYTMQLAGRGLERGIQVNDVGPGPVNTPLTPAFTQQVGEAQMQWLNAQVGRAGTASDIAEVLTWLAVGAHDWLNGQHIVVDGGLNAGLQSRWVDRSTAPR